MTNDPIAQWRGRVEHCEKVLREAIRQIRQDADIMFEGEPHSDTDAEIQWEEYRRVWGIGRK